LRGKRTQKAELKNETRTRGKQLQIAESRPETQKKRKETIAEREKRSVKKAF